MRIAICDDEPALLARLELLIQTWARGRGCSCQIAAFSSGEAFLFETAGSYPFDLMLLDVELGGIGGFQLAKTVRETDEKVPLAFLTNHAGYVFKGYEVAALRYLLKPVTAEKLFPLLDLIWERMGQEPAYLLLPVDGETRRVNQEDILCLEAQGHTVRIETVRETLAVKAPLASLAGKLGSSFIPCHRSYVVNLRYVERVARTACFLDGGGSVPVSRGAWEKLNQAFIEYYREA